MPLKVKGPQESVSAVIILAAGAALWSISGLRNENEAPPQRRLNPIGLLLALTAGLIAALHLRH